MANVSDMNPLNEFLKGIVLALLYLQITQANDTNTENVLKYAFFYVLMVAGALFSGIEPNVVTNSFITKTIFTLVDERVKKKNVEN